MQLTTVEAASSARSSKKKSPPRVLPALAQRASSTPATRRTIATRSPPSTRPKSRQALHGLETERLAAPVRGEIPRPQIRTPRPGSLHFTRGESPYSASSSCADRKPPANSATARAHVQVRRAQRRPDVLQKLMAREPALVKILPASRAPKRPATPTCSPAT